MRGQSLKIINLRERSNRVFSSKTHDRLLVSTASSDMEFRVPGHVKKDTAGCMCDMKGKIMVFLTPVS